jgi:hypothetical protein
MDLRRRSSHGLVLSCRGLRAPSRRASFAILPDRTGSHGSSHEVLRPFDVFPHAAAAWWSGLPRPTACALRFSQPLGAFIRPVPVGLVSCRIRPWGRALQSLPPPAEPCALSDACAPRDVGWYPSPSPLRPEDPRVSSGKAAIASHGGIRRSGSNRGSFSPVSRVRRSGRSKPASLDSREPPPKRRLARASRAELSAGADIPAIPAHRGCRSTPRGRPPARP